MREACSIHRPARASYMGSWQHSGLTDCRHCDDMTAADIGAPLSPPQLVGLGLCAREAIPLSFIAFTAIGIVLTINGTIGATTHCSFPVIVSRPPIEGTTSARLPLCYASAPPPTC